MKDLTIQSYDENAVNIAGEYEEVTPRVWSCVIPMLSPGAKVLDVGCGSGRDLYRLHKAGLKCWGLDPSVGMISEAKRRHPEIAEKLCVGKLPPEEGIIMAPPFDLVSLIAVLMHMGDEELLSVLSYLKLIIAKNGFLLISCSLNRSGLNQELRDASHRLYHERQPQEYQALLKKLGFQMVKEWRDVDCMGRKIQWFSQLYQ